MNSYQDWGIYALPENGTENVWEGPESCCYYSGCSYIYEQGCLSRLTYVISQCAVLLGSGALCVAFVQVLLAEAFRKFGITDCAFLCSCWV